MAAKTATRQVSVAIIGAGGVGKCFIGQLAKLAERLSKENSPTRLTAVLIARSKQMLYSPAYRPLSLSSWQDDLAATKQPPLDPSKLIEYIAGAPGKIVLVDNTSSEELGKQYPAFLSKGISIVTPNKKAFSGSIELWREIFAAAANGTGNGGYLFHESTVGAGLPVISTIKDLVETGDEVTKIQGVFSGTMSFLFNSFMPVGTARGGRFSAEVKKAKELGYTEPDPRDDLNGLDVARKLTILARLAGLDVANPTAFPIQSLVPPELESCASGDEFMSRLHEFDDRMEKLKLDAAGKGKVIRFVGSIDVENCDIKVGVETFDSTHPIAALQGSDNIISFYTNRYGANPLIIQGAGAGGEVTAMGTTADLIKVIRLLDFSN